MRQRNEELECRGDPANVRSRLNRVSYDDTDEDCVEKPS